LADVWVKKKQVCSPHLCVAPEKDALNTSTHKGMQALAEGRGGLAHARGTALLLFYVCVISWLRVVWGKERSDSGMGE
jgi:hypothetical protein